MYLGYFSLDRIYVLNQGAEVKVYIQNEGVRAINVVWITEGVFKGCDKRNYGSFIWYSADIVG